MLRVLSHRLPLSIWNPSSTTHSKSGDSNNKRISNRMGSKNGERIPDTPMPLLNQKHDCCTLSLHYLHHGRMQSTEAVRHCPSVEAEPSSVGLLATCTGRLICTRTDVECQRRTRRRAGHRKRPPVEARRGRAHHRTRTLLQLHRFEMPRVAATSGRPMSRGHGCK